MKKKTAVTLQDVIDYVNEHGIPYDIPIGLALCDNEHGDVCTGIVVDTPDETCPFDEKEHHYVRTETTGQHCDLKGWSPLDTLTHIPLEKRRVLMLTDGCHREYE